MAGNEQSTKICGIGFAGVGAKVFTKICGIGFAGVGAIVFTKYNQNFSSKIVTALADMDVK